MDVDPAEVLAAMDAPGVERLPIRPMVGGREAMITGTAVGGLRLSVSG